MRRLPFLLIILLATGCGLLPGGEEEPAGPAGELSSLRATYNAGEEAARVSIREWDGDVDVARAAYTRLAANSADLAAGMAALPGAELAVTAANDLAELQRSMAAGDVALWTSLSEEYEVARAELAAALDALAAELGSAPDVSGAPSPASAAPASS